MATNNLRIIYDNAADRASLLTADTTAGLLAVTSLQTDSKSDVHRTTQKSVSYKLRWAAAEKVGGVFLPFCNFSDTALMRVRATSEVAMTNLLPFSEGTVAQSNASGVTNAASPLPNFANTIKYDYQAASIYCYKTFNTVSGTTYTFSVFIQMDDAGVPVVGTSTSTGDCAITLESILQTTASTVTNLGNGLYRISKTFTASTTSTNYGIIKYNSQSVRGFRASGMQLEVGTVMTSYYPTGAAAATRPIGYIDNWQSYQYDSGSLTACPGGGVNIRNWANTPIGANAYAYGGGACARHWLTAQANFTGVSVDVSDPNNTAAYLEAARLIVGAYWSPTYNAEYDATTTPIDNSRSFENDAGDTLSIVGTKSIKQSITLAHMPLADRDALWDILWGNGTTIPIMFSLYPNDPSGKLERSHQLYAKLVQLPGISTPFYYRYSTSIEIKQV